MQRPLLLICPRRFVAHVCRYSTQLEAFTPIRNLRTCNTSSTRIGWAVKKFPEEWYCTVMVGHANGHLINFKSGPIFIETLTPSILPLFKAPAEGFFWNPQQLGRRIPFDALHCCETCLHEAHFQSREQPKSLEARSGECGDWVMTQEAMCGSVCYREAEATAPACLPATCRSVSSAILARKNDR
jgi:hypothetical protein